MSSIVIATVYPWLSAAFTHSLTFALGWWLCTGLRAYVDYRRRERLRRSSESLMPPYLPEAEYKR